MALRLLQRLSRWDDFTDIDLPAIGACDFRLAVSYSHAARLTWHCIEPQHTAPIPGGCFIKFWDEGANDPHGAPFSETNPLFEGYVEVPEPSDQSIGVNYTAYDPTFRAGRMLKIFNKPWPFGDKFADPPEPPVRPANAVPQVYYNVRISNDPAWAQQVGGNGTLGQLIGGILDYTENALVWCDAAPGDGTEAGAERAYDQDDLDALTVIPQEKLDFSSESPFSAIQRCMRYDPRYRCVWEPGSRLWRFHNITTAPTKTITLNEGTASFVPMTLRLIPSAENCITAISIFGPPAPYTVDLRWDDPVDPYGPEGEWPDPEAEVVPYGGLVNFETFSTAGGMFLARFWRYWQIYEPSQRHGDRELPAAYAYQNAFNLPNATQQPIALLSWDRGATWQGWQADFDYQHGIIDFGIAPFYGPHFKRDGSSLIDGSTQKFFPPTSLRLIWAPYGAPLEVRRPETGYEGTAYTNLGLRYEDFQNDHALAVGKEFGQPVTTAERRAAFETYAQTILDQRKDVVWTGGAQIDGLDWDYCRLNKKVQILAQDGSGNPLTTGWETIEAYVTDVEYDLEEQTTSLTFSADKLALFGMEPALLREQLKIRPLQQMIEYQTRFLYDMLPLPNGRLVRQVVGVQTTPVFHYVDDPTAAQQQQYQRYQQAMAGASALSGGAGA